MVKSKGFHDKLFLLISQLWIKWHHLFTPNSSYRSILFSLFQDFFLRFPSLSTSMMGRHLASYSLRLSMKRGLGRVMVRSFLKSSLSLQKSDNDSHPETRPCEWSSFVSVVNYSGAYFEYFLHGVAVNSWVHIYIYFMMIFNVYLAWLFIWESSTWLKNLTIRPQD